MNTISTKWPALVLVLLPLFCLAQSGAVPHDWLTWGGAPDRSGWARSETILSKDNVAKMELKWMAQLDNPASDTVLSAVTAPLVAENIATAQGRKNLIYVVGSADIVYALDEASGSVVWQKKFPNTLRPRQNASVSCSNTQQATPVIDKAAGIIYVLTSDGKLRGLSLTDGSDRMAAVDFVTPFVRDWSLNLVDGVIVTTFGRGCGGAAGGTALPAAELASIDVKDPAHPKKKFNTSTGRPNGAWGRGSTTLGSRGIYVMTADGAIDPSSNLFGESFMIFNPKTMEVVDYYTPKNWQYLNEKDLDLGSASPLVFNFRNWEIVAGIAKEGVMYLLDGKSLGGQDHQTPLFVSQRWANDEVLLYGRGVWGAMATWEDPQGQRWLYVPIWGPPTTPLPKFKNIYGTQESGSIMAFQLGVENEKPSLTPMWISESMSVPDPPVVANGVVFSVSTGENPRQAGWAGNNRDDRAAYTGHASLRAFDASTGKQLYHSGSIVDDWTHFSGLGVSNGRVYFTTTHSRVYSFGLPNASH
jgi:outer membrane protein assembly factor BamB